MPAIEDLESVLDRFLMHGQTTSPFVVATWSHRAGRAEDCLLLKVHVPVRRRDPVAPRTVLPQTLR